ncbi:YibE/F family protein [Corynebacterium sp. HS2168-gen11]|uniref:YibE/F family protein n=1 Tax=Corynebacterium sp. HS2168-gen11 TaxID=2974027 RepID=UPI00216B6190|nr:YibE/F family protein [Corynebacterium sp. HS2168-gen11]MCS4536005.1 YibE/F family protein [Corynebacterium sp. HS2168-gen11]
MGKHAQLDHPSHQHTWTLWRVVLFVFLILWGAASIIGTAMLWPGDKQPNIAPEFYSAFSLGHKQVAGTVVSEDQGACNAPESGQVFDTSPRIAPGSTENCNWFIVELTEGEHAGKRTLLVNTGQVGDPELAVGAHIKLLESSSDTGEKSYAFGDIDRTIPLAIWACIFAASIIALALMRGVRALVGLIITMAIVGYFTLPALLLGENPMAIAVFSGALILLTVVIFVHGFNWKSASALGGTLTALAISAWLATIAIDHNQLRGLGEDGNLYILLYLPDVNVIGLMLCGFTIGSLGVLNDVAIAQSSTVNELAELNPDATPWQLFVSAMRVGRDHISSMVYTLVLTYTGASLPMLLLLSVVERPLGQFFTSDIMATELMRSGVGALALTLAVPITTLFAAYTVSTSALHATGAKDIVMGGHSH